MIKYTKCPGCKSEQVLKASANTRGDLQMKFGNEVKQNCSNCGKMYNAHLNEVKAKVDKRIIIAGVIVSVIATAFLWFMFGAVGVVSGVIPIIFWKQQESQVSSFNRFKIKK